MRRLIVTADDFGMSLEVNEAIEIAHRQGILTCASLVVAGDAAQDAIERARRMPALGVGLHLALFGAHAAYSVPSIVAPDGRDLGERPVRTGTAIMLSARAREAARREIAAQFDAYRRSGIPLGHLDGHWHCHQHPTVLAMALQEGRPLGLRAVRIPFEPYGFSRRIGAPGHDLQRLAHVAGHAPLAWAMRVQARRAGMRTNDRFFGKTDAGFVTEAMLLRLVENLPPGVTEIGLHPSVGPAGGLQAPPIDWQPQGELAALISPAVAAAAKAAKVHLDRWADLP